MSRFYFNKKKIHHFSIFAISFIHHILRQKSLLALWRLYSKTCAQMKYYSETIHIEFYVIFNFSNATKN